METKLEEENDKKNLWRYVENVRPEIERALNRYLPVVPSHIETQFNDALNYSLFPGGKRLRPVLTLLGAEIVGGCKENVMPAAVAIEYIHTSSLIFDDLPCMDNANERRGKLSLHLKYNEGLSILVALSLLNASYGLIFDCATKDESLLIKAHAEMVECIGSHGMVAGQSIDLAVANKLQVLSRDGFETTRNLKTSALIRMALRVGAILSDANETELNALSRFADLIGDAYQTSDDLLDLQKDATLVAEASRHETIALENGTNSTKERINSLITQAKKGLDGEFGQSESVNLLSGMADYIADRRS
jgi:geranylgeranyl diphosphate synthase type II